MLINWFGDQGEQLFEVGRFNIPINTVHSNGKIESRLVYKVMLIRYSRLGQGRMGMVGYDMVWEGRAG